ncbi:MAG: hypothetical protein HGA27_00275 [Peptococcaceae bacterium]|nr:hypothetical protein [Peptococcaceae bacterium]
MAEIKLEGLDQLLQNLQQVGKKVSATENKALRAGADIVKESASKKAPRSKLNRSHLADNIAISNVKTQDGIKHIEVGPQKGDNSPFFYGKFLEFGTSKMAAKPFLYPALIETRSEAVNAMAEVIRGALKK